MATKKILAAAVLTIAVIGACGGKEEIPPNTPQPYASGAYPPPPPGYPPPGYPPPTAQPQPTGYPPPQPTGAPTAAPTAAPPAATMATPGPLALPCQNDGACGFARCNVQFQKCAFPCVNAAVDCAPGHGCNTMTGLCLPGAH